MEKRLGGVMIWSIDIDDFRGECVEGEIGHGTQKRFPLLHSINEVLSTYAIPKEDITNVYSTEEPTNDVTNRTKKGEKSSATVPVLASVLLLSFVWLQLQ